MAEPTLIHGPAYVKFGSKVYYTEGDITLSYDLETFNPVTSHQGALGERMKYRKGTLRFKPAGNLAVASAVANYLPHLGSGVVIGASLLSTDDVVVAPIGSGNKHTWTSGCITTMPSLRLSAHSTCWDSDIEFTVYGDAASDPTSANFWETIAATAADTSFDVSTILTPRYTATYGSYASMEPDESGFLLVPSMTVNEIPLPNYGTKRPVLASVSLECRFRPIGLTESDYVAMAKLENTGALMPGDLIGTASDLVISGTGVTVTAKTMGVKNIGWQWGVTPYRQGEVVMVNKLGFSTGARQAMLTIA